LLASAVPPRRGGVNSPASHSRAGLAQALGAAVVWGIIPLYFKLLSSIDAGEVVAYRIIWSVPLLLAILSWRGEIGRMGAALSVPRTRGLLLLSSLFIAGNWIVYVLAVNGGHVLAASLGYFISPLFTVILGATVLGERLQRLQWVAVAIAAGGVAVLGAGAWQTLWISLALAGLWGLYSLVRRVAVVDAMPGLAVETVILLPMALGWIGWQAMLGVAHPFGHNLWIDALLIGTGAVTALPLLLFNLAVKKLSFATMGLVQYVAPTIQFLLAIFLFREPLTIAHLIAFPLIWTGLAIYSWSAWRTFSKAVR
jgi:chloramphenicol-sensitive protein RarD